MFDVTWRIGNAHFLIPAMSEIRARELAEYDDISNSLCVDPMIGFTTHKMSPRYFPVLETSLVALATEQTYSTNFLLALGLSSPLLVSCLFSARFRHVKGRFPKLRTIVAQYRQDCDEAKAYRSLVLNSTWARSYLMRKSKKQLESLREHVSELMAVS